MSYLDVVGVGDSVEYLKQIPDNSVDACVCDPPYGLGKEPDPVQVMTAWAQGKTINVEGSGFMYKEWDAFVPQPDLWREVYRVLKPGAYCLAFYGTRTYDWGAMAMRFAGFEIVDSCMWLYATGFPKSLNVAKAIDGYVATGNSDSVAQKFANDELREGEGRVRASGNSIDGMMNASDNQAKVIRDEPATEEGRRWKGWGTQLKPAHEPVLLARKPFDGPFAPNVLKHGTGALNIDGCRIAVSDRQTYEANCSGDRGHDTNRSRDLDFKMGCGRASSDGRWPANVILSHSLECEYVGTKMVKGHRGYPNGPGGDHSASYRAERGDAKTFRPSCKADNEAWDGYADADGNETVETWNCAPGCPVAELDRQSGGSGASRFFACFRYQAKPGKAEREMGLEDFPLRSAKKLNEGGIQRRRDAQAEAAIAAATDESGRKLVREDGSEETVDGDVPQYRANIHPTVKPVELMRWLVRLVTQPGGIVLDPFMGSGTTGMAAVMEGMHFIGVEREPEYAEIANARIKSVSKQTSTDQLQSGDVLCPGCKSRGQVKLIDKSALERSQATGRKITCSKCFKRYTYDELRGGNG